MDTLLIFTDAATSAKMHKAVGVFLCISKKNLPTYADCNAQDLHKKIGHHLVYLEYETKKSTWSEITTVIQALESLDEKCNPKQKIEIYTDCQSFCDLLGKRKEKLLQNNFITRTGKILQNAELYKKLYLIADKFEIQTFKIKGHRPKSYRANAVERIFAVIDKLSRGKLRLIL
jgi:ribonuclease HI